MPVVSGIHICAHLVDGIPEFIIQLVEVQLLSVVHNRYNAKNCLRDLHDECCFREKVAFLSGGNQTRHMCNKLFQKQSECYLGRNLDFVQNPYLSIRKTHMQH